MIGTLIVVLALVGVFVWFSLQRRVPSGATATLDSRTAEELQTWLDAGLITGEQVESITAFVVRPAKGPPRVSLLTEALAYIGAVLVLAGGGAALGESWDRFSPSGHVAVFAVAALLSFAGGWAIRRADEPAFQRLMGVLWFLSVGAIAAGVGFLCREVAELSPEVTVPLVGGAVTVYAGALWWTCRRVLQLVALVAGVHVAVMGALGAPPGERSSLVYAAAVWAIGAVSMALGWRGRIEPAWALLPIGALDMLVGPAITVQDHGWMYVVAFVTAAALMALSVAGRQLPLLALGALGMLAYATSVVMRYLRDSLGIPVALSLVGLVILVVAVVTARLRVLTVREPPGGATGNHRVRRAA